MPDVPLSAPPPGPMPGPPWPAVAVGLVAYAVLGFLGSGALLLGLLALALAAVCVVPARLPDLWWVTWLVRVPLFTLVIVWNVQGPVWTPGHREYDPSLISMVPIAGQLLAAELLLEAWRRRPSGGPRGAGLVLLATLVFLTACTTFAHRPPSLFAPLFIVFLVPALRAVRDRQGAGALGAGIGRGRLRWALPLVLVLGLGGAVSELLWAWRAEISVILTQMDRSLFLRRRQVGFSDTPSLGSAFVIESEPARVLLLEGPEPDSHLRGLAFDTYKGGAWGPPLVERSWAEVDRALLRGDAAGARCRATRLADGIPVLFAPLDAAGLDPAPDGEIPVRWDGAAGAALAVTAPAPYAYELVLPARPARQGPLCVPPGAAERARCLAVPPEIDPGVRALATRLAGGLASGPDRVVAIVRHLQSEHKYSRTIDPGPGDPVSNFLLQKKDAHCEYFASAATMLLRCVGIPTRYVVGYYAHESEGEGVLVVRQQDSHAWAESWLDGVGWVTVEATPGNGLPEVTARKAGAWQRFWERLSDRLAALGRRLVAVPWLRLGFVLAVVLVALRIGRALWGRRRRAAVGGDYAPPGAALAAVAARFEHHLRTLGMACPLHRTWREHLAAAATAATAMGHGPAARRDRVREAEFIAEYNRVRFGRPEDRAAVGRLDAMLRALEGRGRA